LRCLGYRQRKYYALTRKGRAELGRRLDEWQAFSGAINMVLGDGGGAQ
jgi:DNA-binding PadR family transcriptional regulator